MSHNVQIENSCNQILQSIKSSSLNYSAQVTPFSIYVTIRKSLVKKLINSPVDQAQTLFENQSEVCSETEALRSQCKVLETSNNSIKDALEQEVKDNEYKSNIIETLEKCLEDARTELNDIVEAKSEVSNEHEAMIKENKKLAGELMKKGNAIDNLKSANEKLKNEQENSECNAKSTAKLVKIKDKELHNLKKENETVKDNLDRLKVELK